MITVDRKYRAIATLALTLVLVVEANALLTYNTNTPANGQVVVAGSIKLLALYKDAALTQNLTVLSYPQTEPFNGPLPSNERVWVKNIHTAAVSVTITMTGLPLGMSFATLTNNSLAPGAVWQVGTMNVTVTTSVAPQIWSAVAHFNAVAQ